MSQYRTIYHGNFIHTPTPAKLEVLHSALVCVGPEGVIEWIEEDVQGEMIQDISGRYGIDLLDGAATAAVQVVQIPQGEFVCPGLVDTHTHAPQYPNIGLGGALQLLDWLEQLTFPEERKFADIEYARQVYGRVVERGLGFGTTTCCYYATTHVEASLALAGICLERGQRAFVGKCCMDRNCPHDYVETTEDSIQDTEKFLSAILSTSSSSSKSLAPLVQPILTPRFAISCTPQLLSSLASISKTYTPPLLIQTHLSENLAECDVAAELFPDSKSYAAVYADHGLLAPGTILAHCVHLSDEEMDLIRDTGAGIAHCPNSNTHLSSGCARVRTMLDKGVKVGLGTDCSGGNSPTIMTAMRHASDVSRFRSFVDQSTSSLSLAEIFYLATMGGATLCRLDQKIGSFAIGKEFDALHIRPVSPTLWAQKGDSEERLFERWIWGGDDRDVADVWVRGRRVAGSA
ncbi:hypothetical protein BCR39DRAFT_472609 [Naematelia encephala]|uniref:Guanine deaminase n=1 Tax=Naematelia encephala TaxID=71784 RepID=A0A1Y2ANS2_9TREE|nr:hypothetical protein BCR39DRAFT_472609 [Naematelia encephala]